MKKSNLFAVTIIGVILLGLFAIGLFALMSLKPGASFGIGDRIAVIPVEGVITDQTAKQVNSFLKQYGEDDRIKAIILRIDSPGGSVAPSQEIHREVVRVKEEKKKKVIVSMGTTAASGGYYIACPADYIFANPATITGSIGVIAEWLNYKDLADWAKLKPVVFKTGEFKDTGSATREITENERKYFQSLIEEMYGQFLAAIMEGRKDRGIADQKITDLTKVKALADGRVFTGQTAKQNGLVDEIGNFEDTVNYTAKLLGIKGEPQLITPPREREGLNVLDLLLGTSKLSSALNGLFEKGLAQGLTEIDSSIKFKYQWK